VRRRVAGKRAIVAAVALAIAVSAAAFMCYVSFASWQGRIGEELSRFALSGNRLPVTVNVFGRGTDTVSARVSFSTADGDLVGTLERSWLGWEIKIDCVLVKAGSGWIVFPFLAYTDQTIPGAGVDLLRYYERAGFPAIYDSSRNTVAERKAMRRIYGLVKTEQWVPTALGSLSHRVVVLRTFKAGSDYSLWVDADGTIRFRED
jgi:hypothetical protein